MGYFRELPNLDYQSFIPIDESDNACGNYIRVKNLFRRSKIRDDLQNVFTLFNKYQIKEPIFNDMKETPSLLQISTSSLPALTSR